MSNPGIFQSSFPAERMRGAKLVEDFRDALTVARNGWTKASLPVFDEGGTFDGIDDSITQPDILLGVNGVSFWITCVGATEQILELSATHSVTVIAGNVTATGPGWGGAAVIYVNGVATTAIGLGRSFVTIVTGTPFTANTIIVGRVGANFGAFKIERLAIWATPSVLTLTEHQAYYNQTMFNWRNRATVDLQMRMQDYDPTNVRTLDSSGHANHFTLGDGSTPTTYPTQGAGRMTFDGGDYLDAGDDSDLDFTSAGSLACCFELTAYTTFVVLMSKYIVATGRSGYGLYINNVGGQVRGIVASTTASQTTTLAGPSVQNGIHTAVFTWNGSTLELYVDGLLILSEIQTRVLAPSGQRARVGGPSDLTTYRLTGKMYNSVWCNFAFNATQAADYHLQSMRVLGSEV